RLVLVEPVDEVVELVDPLPGMEPRVGADADRVRARTERDHPHPVARVHEMHGGQRAEAALVDPVDPLLVVAEALDVAPAREPEPGGVDVMARLRLEAELASQDVRAPARVDDPPRPDLARLPVRPLERQPVLLLAELDVLDAVAEEGVRAGL